MNNRFTISGYICGKYSPEHGYIQSVDWSGSYKISPDAGDTSWIYDEPTDYESTQSFWGYVRRQRKRCCYAKLKRR